MHPIDHSFKKCELASKRLFITLVVIENHFRIFFYGKKVK